VTGARHAGFAAVAARDARVLILGSMPGAASLAAGRYYAHPRNQFWSIIGTVSGAEPDLPYGRRIAALRGAGIALWDVVASCHRQGSLDTAIERRALRVNDFAAFLRRHPQVGCVLFNGATAETLFRRHVLPTLEPRALALARLPSTSPAHAGMKYQRKLAQWRRALRQALAAPRAALGLLRRELAAQADPQDAAFLQRYFRTARGEYGAGDRFLGIRVPVLRQLARANRQLGITAIATLLRSRWHEQRLLALLLLVDRYQRGVAAERLRIFRLYLRQVRHVNNWDLVDVSAPVIVGMQLLGAPISALVQLARSPRLWERRIAMLATLPRIRAGNHAATLRLARLLLGDPQDLMHKATGWMLREVGKRDPATLEAFLLRYAHCMPRTMLRYAIEHRPARERARHMAARARSGYHGRHPDTGGQETDHAR
jgi:hypoxanthine-DNA glycosylase